MEPKKPEDIYKTHLENTSKLAIEPPHIFILTRIYLEIRDSFHT